ncbi:hypothetical protein LZ554_007661 [Drepanopeziza brunnea f. sp. 'monogermtubi']|nr:hypothetical protein LZ554_007661 [Drepanopeziza brunnea f. sp. 'monogermtubi']
MTSVVVARHRPAHSIPSIFGICGSCTIKDTSLAWASRISIAPTRAYDERSGQTHSNRRHRATLRVIRKDQSASGWSLNSLSTFISCFLPW